MKQDTHEMSAQGLTQGRLSFRSFFPIISVRSNMHLTLEGKWIATKSVTKPDNKSHLLFNFN